MDGLRVYYGLVLSGLPYIVIIGGMACQHANTINIFILEFL